MHGAGDLSQTLNISGGGMSLSLKLEFLIEMVDCTKYEMGLEFKVDKDCELEPSEVVNLSQNTIMKVES